MPDWEPWTGFFLRCLRKQKDNLAPRLEREETAGADDSELPELSVKIISLIHQHGRQSIAQLVEATGANRNTLKLRLRKLVDIGRIRKHGKARATWYTL